MAVRGQIRELFQSKGLNPKEIRYEEVLDRYRVTIGVEGTEDRFIREPSSLDNADSGAASVDTDELKSMKSRIQGSEVPDGTVIVKDMMIGSHYQIELI